MAEIRSLLERPELRADGVTAEPVHTVEGHQVWSQTYDEPGNGIFEYEEPVVREVLDQSAPGVALDAACGTGRYAEHLVSQGHDVIGVDSSPEMLARARARLPQADFRPGELADLPLPDASVDLVVCSLALTHVAALGPAFAEFARVLRPGGHLVVSDVHPQRVAMGSVPRVRSADGAPRLLPAHRHLASEYLEAALSQGLRPLRCVEPLQRASDPPAAGLRDVGVGPWDQWPWSLLDIAPAAAHAAFLDEPVAIVWHFRAD